MNKKLVFPIYSILILMTHCSPLERELTISALRLDSGTQISETLPTSRTIIQLDHAIHPRVDGSTSTLPLQVTIACHVAGVACDWTEPNPFDSTRRMSPINTFDGLSSEAERISGIWHSGTHGAYESLIGMQSDIILVARPPSEDELEAAERNGISMEVVPIALDAFVFLVHRDNPVSDVDLDEIREIYTGGIRNWGELDGTEGQIHTYRRNRNSGSEELMENLVMVGLPMPDSPDMILESMMGPINAISQDPQGIGYSVYFYAENIYPHEDLKLLGIDGIQPIYETISDRTYPLWTEVYAVIRESTPRGHEARLMRDWLLTPEGQQVVEWSGYVPLEL